MRFVNSSLIVLFLLFSHWGWAQPSLDPIEADRIYQNGIEVSFQEMAQSIEPGSIVIISELHTWTSHHERQFQLLQELRSIRPNTAISVGMEFFDYTKQDVVDEFKNGTLSENDFLTQVGWGGNDYNFYRPLVAFPRVEVGETVIALNAPRSLSSKIARNGLGSLSDEDKSLLPPDFELGRDIYYQRFKENMSHGHQLPEELLRNYFGAQSLWDDTMAWQAVNYLEKNPNAILVIIVGDFHNSFGGGLPDRIKARGFDQVRTISQVDILDLTPEEKIEEVVIHPSWGQRADYVWTSAEEVSVGGGF